MKGYAFWQCASSEGLACHGPEVRTVRECYWSRFSAQNRYRVPRAQELVAIHQVVTGACHNYSKLVCPEMEGRSGVIYG